MHFWGPLNECSGARDWRVSLGWLLPALSHVSFMLLIGIFIPFVHIREQTQ